MSHVCINTRNDNVSKQQACKLIKLYRFERLFYERLEGISYPDLPLSTPKAAAIVRILVTTHSFRTALLGLVVPLLLHSISKLPLVMSFENPKLIMLHLSLISL